MTKCRPTHALNGDPDPRYIRQRAIFAKMVWRKTKIVLVVEDRRETTTEKTTSTVVVEQSEISHQQLQQLEVVTVASELQQQQQQLTEDAESSTIVAAQLAHVGRELTSQLAPPAGEQLQPLDAADIAAGGEPTAEMVMLRSASAADAERRPLPDDDGGGGGGVAVDHLERTTRIFTRRFDC